MSKLYLQKELRNDDLQDKVPENIQKIATEYGRQLRELYNCLTGAVDYNNLSAIVRDIEFTTPADYATGGWSVISFPNTLGRNRKAVEVRIAQIAIDQNNFSPILTAVGPPQWAEAAGNIRILYIAGLAASTSYRARLIAT